MIQMVEVFEQRLTWGPVQVLGEGHSEIFVSVVFSESE
jgi:hypothetical protein